MDGKGLINMPFGEQECIDISISYTPACSLYVSLKHGIDQIASDIHEMDKYITFAQKELIGEKELFKSAHDKNKTIASVMEQKKVAKLALENSRKFMTELERVIKELDPDKKKSLIIAPPGWGK